MSPRTHQTPREKALARARRRWLARTITGAAALVLGACQDSPSPLAPPAGPQAAKTGAGKPGSTAAVLFSGRVGQNWDIYIMNPDGQKLRRITTDTAVDQSPDFAPGNRKLVWVRQSDIDHSELYTANVDGSKQAPLTALGKKVYQPRYSPDGTKIAFVTWVTDTSGTTQVNHQEIFVINADGTGLKRLTFDVTDSRAPAWSPDGRTIAYEHSRASVLTIYTMQSDGLNPRPLFDCVDHCVDPAYSPDGSRLAYGSIADGAIGVYRFATNSSMPVGPTTTRLSRYPTWTKDGTQVLFASNRGTEETMELYVGTPNLYPALPVERLTLFAPGEAQEPAYSR